MQETDTVSILDLESLSPRGTVTVTLNHSDGSSDQVELRHSMNEDQLEWFRAGSALNLLRAHGDAG